MNKRRTEVSLVEKNGRTFSKRTEYYESGAVAETGLFACTSNDWAWTIPTGIVKTYYENGKTKSEVSYDEHGSLEGECLYYCEKGNLLKKQKFSNDKLISEENFEPPKSED